MQKTDTPIKVEIITPKNSPHQFSFMNTNKEDVKQQECSITILLFMIIEIIHIGFLIFTPSIELLYTLGSTLLLTLGFLFIVINNMRKKSKSNGGGPDFYYHQRKHVGFSIIAVLPLVFSGFAFVFSILAQVTSVPNEFMYKFIIWFGVPIANIIFSSLIGSIMGYPLYKTIYYLKHNDINKDNILLSNILLISPIFISFLALIISLLKS